VPKPRLLIVDDERELRDVLHEFFEESGYDVIEAADGRVALELLENSQVDVAIVDIFMPGVDGLELLTVLRKRPKSAKIVAISGGGETQSGDVPLQVARLLGAHATLEKPFDFEVLLSHVKHCLDA
jgi:CheY-like chemotaxis protein